MYPRTLQSYFSVFEISGCFFAVVYFYYSVELRVEFFRHTRTIQYIIILLDLVVVPHGNKATCVAYCSLLLAGVSLVPTAEVRAFFVDDIGSVAGGSLVVLLLLAAGKR
jgi:hypothetical protein